jgi:branched-chain amino acid aminotransferase
MSYISINFQLHKEDEAKILVTDLALQRGYGIFDFLKTIDNRIIFKDDHFDRFYNSARELNLDIDFSREELHNAIVQLMEKNNTPNSGIKFILTGGYSEDGYTMSKPNLVITQVPFEIAKNGLENGMKLVTYNHQRQLANIKTIDYLQAIRLQPFIKEIGANDVLYHDNGYLRECPRANFFIVKGDKVLTAKSGVLKGITRSKVLLLNNENFSIEEQDIILEDLKEATEAFITSSTKNVWPILTVDGQAIGDGKPGKITTLLHDQLLQVIGSN